MGKGSKRRVENFAAVQQNWPANMGKKPYWMSWSKFSDEFYTENPELLTYDFVGDEKQEDKEKEVKLKYKQMVEIAEAQENYL